MYRWIVFLHLVGVFGFLLAHGASAAVAFRLRRAVGLATVRALLALSRATNPLMYGSLALLLAGGIVAGFLGGWWGQGWIWAALGVLAAVTVAVVAIGVPHFRRLRKAVEGMPASVDGSQPSAPAANEVLAALLASQVPLVVAVVGIVGLIIILWLMALKPF
jgi:hypothetical protein